MEIGVQFFTLREHCKDLDSFSESLKRVADIGYKNVQISGTCEFEADWLKTELDKNGLKCVVTHTHPDKLTADAARVAKDHDIFGCENVGLGYHVFPEENPKEVFLEFVNKYMPVAETIAQNGKYFMYHNHDSEFIKFDGKTVFEHIAETFAPEKLGFIIDTYWVQNGGGDPALWIEKFKGRLPCIHLKDYAYGKKMAVVGEGNINFDRVFQKAEEAGTKYMLVEQDNCNGENEFDCLKRSYEFLKSRGFN